MPGLLGRRLHAALLLAAACAAPPKPPPPEPPKPVISAEEEARARARAEDEARARRVAELLDMVDTANLIAMPEEARARLKGATLATVAQLRFEAGDVDGALEIAERAGREVIDSRDEKLIAAVHGSRFLIARFAALAAAKDGQLDRSLALFDRVMLHPGLTAQEKEQLAGDRFLILEMKNAGKPEPGTELNSALARLLGPDAAATPRPSGEAPRGSDTPAPLDMSALRKEIGRTLEKDVAEAQLPTDRGMPAAETGHFDQRTVLAVVSANKKAVSICYEQSIKRGETTRGKLELTVTVEPDGSVSDAKIATASFRGTTMARCITDTVTRWRFPPFEGTAKTVELPFVFNQTF